MRIWVYSNQRAFRPLRESSQAEFTLVRTGRSSAWATYYDVTHTPQTGQMTPIGTIIVARATSRPHHRARSHQGDLPNGLLATRDEYRTPWFSVGQDTTYYENLQKLGLPLRIELLHSLIDIAFDHDVFREALRHQAVRDGMLRHIEPRTVERQFHRLAHGGPRLTPYWFTYAAPDSTRPLDFKVQPDSTPPSNVHVLIGPNGVGKTTLLQNITQSAIEYGDPNQDSSVGKLAHLPVDTTHDGFTNIIWTSFSAFDRIRVVVETWSHDSHPPRYSPVGLSDPATQGEGQPREHFATDFALSAQEILIGQKAPLWLDTLAMLRGDPHFSQTASLLAQTIDGLPPLDGNPPLSNKFLERARQIFGELSSGHAILLLTLTRLVEVVTEQSLVLLDEPEAHLHPPLLSSFIRALSALLTQSNGVAVIATHSPVVLQEVPRSCVHKLSRNGPRIRARRPRIETYGENIGVLTQEIFGLEVMESGFYSEIKNAVKDLDTYDQVLDHFGRQLGDEAKGLVHVLLAAKERGAL
ncbi:AAA family ATPase [Streptomyces sp. NPDC101733]|uniref:AAA family ATPase n=1 Tax=unclassified Streptomyces TaxID=2593676 RepID=UPI0037F74DDC